MKETICYINISAKNDWNKLKAHIRYISRKSSNPYTSLSDISIWEQRKNFEKSKRYDARIALSFVIALPNDRINDVAFFDNVKTFISKFFDVDEQNIDYVVHRNDINNIHMHMLVYPRKRDGKKIDTKISDIKRLHKEYEKFLTQQGYKVRYDTIEEKIDHIGYKNKEALEAYKEKKKLKEELKVLKGTLQQYESDYKKEALKYERELTGLENEIRTIKATAEGLGSNITTETERNFAVGREISAAASKLQQKLRELRNRVQTSRTGIEYNENSFIKTEPVYKGERKENWTTGATRKRTNELHTELTDRIQRFTKESKFNKTIHREVSERYREILTELSRYNQQLSARVNNANSVFKIKLLSTKSLINSVSDTDIRSSLEACEKIAKNIQSSFQNLKSMYIEIQRKRTRDVFTKSQQSINTLLNRLDELILIQRQKEQHNQANRTYPSTSQHHKPREQIQIDPEIKSEVKAHIQYYNDVKKYNQ